MSTVGSTTSTTSTNRVFGLSGSGLDVDSIVTNLMKAERAKQDKIKQNKTIAEWQESAYRDLNDSLRSLRDNVLKMKLQGTYLVKQVSSSNEGIVKATATGSAVVGSNTLQVTQLAANARLNSSAAVTFANADGTTLASQLGLNGTVVFTVNGSQTITIDTGVDSIDTLVSKINGAKMADGTSAGVSATFDKTLNRMFISSTATGSAAQINFSVSTDTSGLFNKLNLDTSKAQTGKDASINYNGMGLTKSSNQFTIAGVSYTLTGTSATETVNINLTSDTDTIYNSIKSFVDLYNTTINSVNTKLSEEKYSDYSPLTDDQRSHLTETQQTQWEDKAKSGLLRNNPILSGIVSKMRSTLSSYVSGVDNDYNSLADIGITTGSYEENGKLYIDDAKLKEAIAADPQSVMDLFTKTSDVTGEQGLAVRLYNNLNNGINQIIDEAGANSSYNLVDNSVLGNKISDYDEQIKDWDTRLEDMEGRYYKQYSALETALYQLNQQSSSLASLLGISTSAG